MTTEIKRLIQVRTDKGAIFKRDGYGKKRQLSDSWRKPRGQHNKQREQRKAKGALPKPGFGSPIAVRGMHPSGFFEALISSAKELDGIDPKTHAIRIGATVGNRARVGLQEKVLAAGFKVLNVRTIKAEHEQEKSKEPAKDMDIKKKEEAKPAKSKVPAAPEKKDTKKVKKTPEAEEKKAPVKQKKPAQQKTDTSKKAPEKTPKKPAKPKTDAPAEVKPKAAPKPRAKKKTESEVKKNE